MARRTQGGVGVDGTSRSTALEPGEQRALFEALLERAPIGFGFWDTELRFVLVNDALAEMNGLPAADHAGRTLAEVVPAVAEEGERMLRRVLESGDPLVGHLLVGETPAHPGVLREWEETVFRVGAPDGRTIGVAAVVVEVTERNELQQRLHEALLEVQADRFRRAIEGMLDAVVIAAPVRDAGGRIVDFRIEYANEAAERGAAATTGTLVGQRLTRVWPRSGRTGVFDLNVRLAAEGVPFHLEDFRYRYTGPDGRETEGVFDLRGTRVGEANLIAWRDVTERALREAELGRHRQASEEVQRIARIGAWYLDVRSRELSWSPQLSRLFGLSPDASPSLEQLLPGLRTMRRGATMEEVRRSMEARESFRFEQWILRADGEERLVQVRGEPMVDRHGELIGIRGTTQDLTELRLAEEARDEATERLEQEQAVVLGLQRSVLTTELPEVPGLGVVARYLTAAAAPEPVGGDWYDVLARPDGCVVLSVGDVAGNGLAATALMARLQHGARMAAIMEPDPARLCGRLDELFSCETTWSFATYLVMVIDPGTGKGTWTSAGHLPPFVRRSDGTVEILPGAARPPLGVPPEGPVPTGTIALEPGDEVILYTDGLVERRGEGIDVGLERLRRALADPVAADLGALCDHLVAACLGAHPTDDLAILAVRRG
jgi:PAS domain S-box-containing protein